MECFYGKLEDCMYIFNNYEDVAENRLTINNNLVQCGGGIFVADDTESGSCSHRNWCYSGKPFFMTSNTANQSGADIYGGLLDRQT